MGLAKPMGGVLATAAYIGVPRAFDIDTGVKPHPCFIWNIFAIEVCWGIER